jgi:uncharacterized protein (DUF1015 family)
VAELRPFAALRYDEERAGPLESLVAPPYDVLSEHERQAYLEKSPYNVVHLTLPDSEEQAARSTLPSGRSSRTTSARTALRARDAGSSRR